MLEAAVLLADAPVLVWMRRNFIDKSSGRLAVRRAIGVTARESFERNIGMPSLMPTSAWFRSSARGAGDRCGIRQQSSLVSLRWRAHFVVWTAIDRSRMGWCLFVFVSTKTFEFVHGMFVLSGSFVFSILQEQTGT